MGGGKKYRVNSLYNRKPSNASILPNSSHLAPQHFSSCLSDEQVPAITVDSSYLLDGTLPHFNWCDLLLLVAVMVSAIVLSAFLGMIAIMSLTIHYNSQDTTVASMVLRGHKSALPPSALVFMTSTTNGRPMRSTLSDTRIAGVGDSILERFFIYTSPRTGKQDVLMVMDKSLSLNASSEDYRRWDENRKIFVRVPPHMDFYQWTRVHPRICPDGITIGYNSWNTLKAAIQEANAFSAEKFVRNSMHFALADSNYFMDNPVIYYEDQTVLTICPNTLLRANYAPIFVNAENIRVECSGCSVEFGSSHLSFGPHARNVLIKGVFFKKAVTSSLVFYHDGAEISFEDCRWIDNEAVHNKVGSVADVNSSSVVHFYRCAVGKRTDTPSGFVSALSIRTS